MKKKIKIPENHNLYLKISLSIYLIFQLLIFIVFSIFVIIDEGPLSQYFYFTIYSLPFIMTFVTLSMVALVSSVAIYFISRKMFKPLVDLSKSSMEVAKGDFSIRVNEKANIPELQTTLKNFNIMVDELSKVETLSNDFVSNVSHEFKTPLSSIRSSVNLLQEGNLTKEEQDKYLKQIDTSVEKLSNLVSSVLRICKLENQKEQVEFKAFRLDEQIRQSILIFADLLESKNIDLDLDLDDLVIYSDESLTDQIWQNIISNAIKFTPENGKITITLKLDESLNTIVTFKDNGVGMDEETKKRIFDRFYQGETSHSKDGNGLGLSIVSVICRLLKIQIKVDSILNQGTKFIFIIPASSHRELLKE